MKLLEDRYERTETPTNVRRQDVKRNSLVTGSHAPLAPTPAKSSRVDDGTRQLAGAWRSCRSTAKSTWNDKISRDRRPASPYDMKILSNALSMDRLTMDTKILETGSGTYPPAVAEITPNISLLCRGLAAARISADFSLFPRAGGKTGQEL